MTDKEVQIVLDRLNITRTGNFIEDGKYEIILRDSNEYAAVYTKLDKLNDAYLDTDISSTSVTDSKLFYDLDDYIIELKANFIDDKYSIIIISEAGN